MTKIDIISGFLGAGKTTLIKKLLDESFKGEKIVLIENEFGEIGIDGGFLKDAGVEITEMNSGCICCSLVGDFGAALKQVLADYAPARIVIEPSGVGKLSDVIAAVERVQAESPDLHLNSFVTVVDAAKAKVYMKNFGEFFNDQVEHACAIILSRTQKIDQHKLDGAVTLLREKNPKAAILTTPWDQLTGAQILAAMEGGHSLAEELMEEINERCGGKGVICDDNISKVSIVGAGMQSNPGVASKMFEALAEANVNIQMISTSEIKISVLVKLSDADKAVNAIHDAFEL